MIDVKEETKLWGLSIIIVAIATAGAFLIWQNQQPKFRESSVEDTTDWYACASSEDCIVVSGVCGSIEAINKQYEFYWSDEKKFQEQYVRCQAPRDHISDFTAQCETNKCVAKRNDATGGDIVTWKAYRNEEFEFEYPENLKLFAEDGKVVLSHDIPYKNNGDCDMMGDDKTYTTLTDFNVSFELITRKIIPDFIDGEYTAGDLKGSWVIDGAEGCGEIVYYFPVQESTALVVKKAAVQALSGISAFWNREEILKVPGVISREESEKILNQILSTLKFFDPANDISGWQTYRNDEYGFELRYPADQIDYLAQGVVDDVPLGFIPVCYDEISSVCVVVGQQQYSNTNFESAGFSVNILKGFTEDACISTLPQPVSFEVIQGVNFSKASNGAGAGGHTQEGVLYRAFHNKTCYEITNLISTSNYYNYEPGTIQQFNSEDASKLQRLLHNITQTFVFTR